MTINRDAAVGVDETGNFVLVKRDPKPDALEQIAHLRETVQAQSEGMELMRQRIKNLEYTVKELTPWPKV